MYRRTNEGAQQREKVKEGKMREFNIWRRMEIRNNKKRMKEGIERRDIESEMIRVERGQE